MTLNTDTKSNLFQDQLTSTDPEITEALQKEQIRQSDQIELIASENIASLAVIQAQGSVMTNKYAEGYPGKRYYGGCEYYDVVENLAIDRAKKIFNCKYANVQPNSGSQANQAVMLALVKPHDTVVGMSLDAGGHLTHGAAPNVSGKWFNAVQYGVKKEDALLDYEQIEKLSVENKAKIIIAGGSAYPRIIDFKRIREIADKVGAYFLVDMAHFAGCVAGEQYPNPIEHAHVVTTTTHKTLRGPRGGMILSNDEELGKKFNSAVFPGMQGGPLMHVIAAKAVAYGEALQPEFKEYISDVVKNAKMLASTLIKRGVDIVSGGTDSHLVLVDLRPKKLTGKDAEASLERAGLTCNKNGVPFDPEKPWVTSGVRLGSPAGTSRGFKEKECIELTNWMCDVIDDLDNTDTQTSVRKKVLELCRKFPVYAKSYETVKALKSVSSA